MKVHWGLEGVKVTESTVSTVGVDGVGLTYRGYKIIDILKKCSYTNVAVLLLKGECGTNAECEAFDRLTSAARTLTNEQKLIIESIDREMHPMDIIRLFSHQNTTFINNHCKNLEQGDNILNFKEVAYLLGVFPSA